MPTWDLSIVFRALRGPPFELLQLADLLHLSLKTTLLLALAWVKRIGELQALLVSASCLKFGSKDCKVILGYVPKLLSALLRAQVITLLALPSSEDEQGPNPLCPVRGLRVYVECSGVIQHLEQLFVWFGGCSKGLPVMKQ